MSSRGSRRAGSGLLIARGRAVGLLAVVPVAGFLCPASAGASVTTFSYTGREQTYKVPAGVGSLCRSSSAVSHELWPMSSPNPARRIDA